MKLLPLFFLLEPLNENMSDLIRKFTSLPRASLPLSASVDFFHFIFCSKPAVRVKLECLDGVVEISEWCQQYDYFLDIDADGFICIAHDLSLAKTILLVDQSKEPHEEVLGQFLGYPLCCCRFVATVKEENIDEFAKEVANWYFPKPFHIINPSKYREGQSLICHLPCSPTCLSSLEIAKKALTIVISNANNPVIIPWRIWLDFTTKVDS